MADAPKKDGEAAPAAGAAAPGAPDPAAPADAAAKGAEPAAGATAAPAAGGAPASAPDAVAGSDAAKPAEGGVEKAAAVAQEGVQAAADDATKVANAAAKSAAKAAKDAEKSAAWRKLKKQNKKKKKDDAAAAAEEDDEAPPMPQKSIVQKLCPCIPGKKGGGKYNFDQGDGVPYDKRFRPFELTMSVNGVENVLADPIDAFFCISIVPVNAKIHKNKCKDQLNASHTRAKVFAGGEKFVHSEPEQLYLRQFFALSYKEMEKHQLQVQMWKISKCTFNTYHGCGAKNLFDIAKSNPKMSIFIKKVVKVDPNKKKKGKGDVYDVALFNANVQLEEVFDFKLRFENFSFEPSSDHKEYNKWMKMKKQLSFVVPKQFNSDVSNNRKCNRKNQQWTPPMENGFIWKAPLESVFTGTRSQLTTSCFLVNVFTGNPTNDNMPAFGPCIGKALMGLTSVLDLSVFRGTVKNMSNDLAEFTVGALSGNVRYQLRSKGVGSYLDVLPLGVPVQPTEASIAHLKKRDTHLVVSINKCDGLAVANPDLGTSDPFLSVSWDNMLKKSWVARGTTRPVFNMHFFFPVRLFNPKLESQRYRELALLHELESKGPIQIMVWDDDPNSSELLGAFHVQMSDILSMVTKEDRTLRAAVKKADEDAEVNEFQKPANPQWFDKPKKCRIFDAGKGVGGVELTGSQLKPTSGQVPRIFFEAYFYPDEWPMNFKFGTDKAKELAEKWQAKEKSWIKDRKEHQKQYKAAFAESIGALDVKFEKGEGGSRSDPLRRFPCLAQNQMLVPVALPGFLVKVIMPDEYTRAPWLLHWLNCFPFHSDSRQVRNGTVEKWNDPQMLLFARRGSPQDHALLLCSILLGCKKDAYVCKGMVWQKEADVFEKKKDDKAAKNKEEAPVRWKLSEHVWVMTREPKDWVTFWEPCTREIYHMPGRHKDKVKGKKGAGKAGAAGGDAEDGTVAVVEEDDEVVEHEEEEVYLDEVPDVTLGPEQIEALPTIGRTPKAKVKVGKKDDASAKSKAAMLRQRERLPIAPNRKFLDVDHLVDWMPYNSIEVIFNRQNVWANMQNHHPACIDYQLDENSTGWAPLLKNDEERKEYKIEYMLTDVVMDPVPTQQDIKRIEYKTVTEMQENMRLNRRNRGLDSVFDLSEGMSRYCDLFLDIHEAMRKLDVDKPMCPLWTTPEKEWTEAMKYTFKLLKSKRPYNKFGSAFGTDDNYVSGQQAGWEEVFSMIEQFHGMKTEFPSKRGKGFDGFPVHFSTADRDDMRRYLMKLPGYTEILEDTQENTAFVVHCKIFGFLNGIPSVWLYFGKHAPPKKPPS